jgi:hypothetical protein
MKRPLLRGNFGELVVCVVIKRRVWRLHGVKGKCKREERTIETEL